MRLIFNDLSFSAASAGILSAFVGFAGSFAIVVQGLTSVGASPQQAASGLMAAAIAMGLCAISLSLRSGDPISIAWSTPGAAFLATLGVPEGGFAVAVGAFLVTAVLIILAGMWKPLGRAVSAIPTPLASAMLAGVLLPLCLAPFEAIAQYPALGLPIVLAWLAVGRFNKLFAVPAAVLTAALLIGINFRGEIDGAEMAWSGLVLVEPSFSLSAITGIAIPLFIITMASQNITGIAVLSNFDYHPDPGKMFSWTGLFSLVGAPFGSHAVNLAAITAAICAGDDAHPDRTRRYWAAVVAGIVYILFGLTAGFAVAFMSISPPILIAAVAGLALLGALASALIAAMSEPKDQEAALITFLITASGITFFGIGGAFWGLLAGGAVYFLHRARA